VDETFQIFGKITEQNPSYNGISYGNKLGSIKFNLKVNNEVYPVTTQSDGSWSHDYTPHNSGTHKVEAHWTGNSTHPMFNQKTSINIK
jgi:hypothetical protein